MKRRRVILVVGSHRSGTSAVAGSLARAGLPFGDRLIEPNAGNELGYFEDRDLVQRNDMLLACYGRTWHDPRPLPSGWLDDPAIAEVSRDLRSVLAERLAVHPVFGLKDPRLCLLLPLYDRLLAELDADRQCVIVLRHATEVAQSLSRRDGFAPGKASMLWLRDNLSAERSSRGLERTFVRFDQLVEDPDDLLAELWSRIQFDPVPDWRQRVRDGLRDQLRHHRCAEPPEHAWLALTFDSLCALARGDESADSLQRLDEIAAALNMAVPLFDSSIGDLAARLEAAHLALRIESGSALDAVHDRLLDGLRQELIPELRQMEAEAQQHRVEREALAQDLARARAAERAAVHELGRLRRSLSWRATAPVRAAVDLLGRGLQRARQVRQVVTADRVRAGLRLLRAGRFREVWHQTRSVAELELARHEVAPGPAGFALPAPRDPYQLHCEHNRLTSRRRRWLQRRLDACSGRLPRVSIVVPVYEPPPRFLELAVQSVRAQVHGDWELVLCDDCSPSPGVRELLDRLAAGDSRISVRHRDRNGGIAAATTTAVAAASGDVLLFLDQDDLLTADAVAEVALAVAEQGADLIYSDDDKVDPDGRRFAPQFKPDWSPELLLSFSYFSHLFALRRSLFDAAGGLRPGFDGAQDYDLMLRAAERAERIVHVPRVLYHWRAHGDSTAVDGRAKSASIDAGRRAAAEAFSRRGSPVPVVVPDWAADAGCGIFAPRFPDHGPRVAIVIPSRDRIDLLERCVAAIERHTTYRDYEIVLIDNGSVESVSAAWFATAKHRVLRIENPLAGTAGFSYAAINNRAVEQIDTEFVLLLNNDTEVRTGAWLSQMVGYAQLPGVGVVGARLLLPDGRLQHAGIVQGLYEGMAGPAFKLLPAWDGGHLSLARVARNCSAVTAAALLVRRQLFLAIGGFDEQRFPVAYNDVDLCHRVRAAGHRIVYCPDAELIHVEGGSRGTGQDRPAEEAAFRAAWWRQRDPFYNPNLSLADERFRIRAAAVAIDPGRPIRCVMVGFNLNAEGASNSQFELTLALHARGVIDPVVFSPTDGPLHDEYRRHGIEVVVDTHPMMHVHDQQFLDERMRGFGQRLRALGAEVVYANTMQSYYAVLAASVAGIPSVWNVRESEPWRHYFDFLAPPLRPLALAAFQKAYATVFVAGATMRGYAELDAHGSFRLIRNGLDPERTSARLDGISRAAARRGYGFGDDEIVLLALGTVCERKGQIDAVEAFGRMAVATAAQSRLLIVGDRPSAYSEALHRAIAALPPERRRRVVVEGERTDVAAPFRAADVFVMTSRLESYPRVVLEAMFAGLPIVSTPVFGIAEQVRDDINALLYPPGDTAALARHLDRLAGDAAARAAFALRSREVLDSLPGFEQMVAGYAEVLREAWSTGDDC